MKYRVPHKFFGGTKVSFTYHETWSEAYKYAKRRRVPMFRVEKERDNKYDEQRRLIRLWGSIKPFINRINKRKKYATN